MFQDLHLLDKWKYNASQKYINKNKIGTKWFTFTLYTYGYVMKKGSVIFSSLDFPLITSDNTS